MHSPDHNTPASPVTAEDETCADSTRGSTGVVEERPRISAVDAEEETGVCNEAGANPSPWTWRSTRTSTKASGPLDRDIAVDVCVIGGGIAGLSTAYALCCEGRTVAVLEDGPIGCGQTSRTTAHLSNAIDDRYVVIEKLHGAAGARLAAESHSAAINRIEHTVAEEHIACDFERLDGYLFSSQGKDQDWIDLEHQAASRAGLDVQRVVRAPLADFNTGPALRFPRQGQFHPMAYLAGLAKAIELRGGKIFTDTHARTVKGGKPALVTTEHGQQVRAGAVVVATNTPINDLVAIHTKQAAYLSYVIAAPLPVGSAALALYWDDEDPYHYMRLSKVADALGGSRQLLLVGGEDHRSGQATDEAERFARLEHWARARFPTLGPLEFTWSGQVMEPMDGLAFIGRNPMDSDNVYIATGDSGMGMTHGTIAGMLLTDLILGRENPWSALYEPSRKSMRSLTKYAAENVKTALQYADWLTPGDAASTQDIPAGEGAVVRRGLHKVAAWRDERGVLHELSATCPHLGCIVQWNKSEKTWDCPCHGSRFDCSGRAIVGPANRNLKEVSPS
jgi:glycine/D-amino acid oxidase-like deaminating enzyme/nitrite reductase/ring-hydroxylating ferredoxin subunit